MRITLPSGTSAEIARPTGTSDGDQPAYGLVVITDIGGMRPLFDDLVQRLADENGWVVATFELFVGLEDKPLDWRLQHAGQLDDDRVLADAVATADAIGCPTVGIIGFCMGGMFTLKASGTGRFDRAVSFYGMTRIPENWRGGNQREPLDYVTSEGACPVLEIVGTEDSWVPADDIEALRAAGAEVVVYEGADHGFVHDTSRPTHRADDAADAWRRTIEFLRS